MPDDSTFNLKNTRIYSHPSTWLFPPVDMADGIRRRTRGKTIDPRTRNGAGAQGRLDSQHQSDSESRPESEWVAELPIEEEDRDSCGNFMSGILSVTIKDPDLNIFTKVRGPHQYSFFFSVAYF